MSKRSSVISTLISHIAASAGMIGNRGLRFLHEINTFPSFYVHPRNETRKHDGAGTKLAVLQLDVRGYGWHEDLSYIEDLVRGIETAIQTYRRAHPNLIQEARVTTLRTDEGAMAPYCICDLTLEILYTVERFAVYTCDSVLLTCDSTLVTMDKGYS
jgi:hypothetical protein